MKETGNRVFRFRTIFGQEGQYIGLSLEGPTPITNQRLATGKVDPQHSAAFKRYLGFQQARLGPAWVWARPRGVVN